MDWEQSLAETRPLIRAEGSQTSIATLPITNGIELHKYVRNSISPKRRN